jgi:serine phosphatase RsbU (regulator of sigma subunit)
MKKLIIILLFAFVTSNLLAGINNTKIDSALNQIDDYIGSVVKLRQYSDKDLLEYLNAPSNDLTKCKIYNALCWRNFVSDPSKAMKFAKLQQLFAEKINNKDAIITSHDNMSFLFKAFGDHEKSITYMLKALKAKEEINDTAGISVSLSGLGNIYYYLKNYDLALNYMNQSYEIEKKINNQSIEGIKRKTSIMNNIGLCYISLNKINEALDIFFEAIDIYINTDTEQNAGSTYANIGYIYMNNKTDYSKALLYMNKALKLHEKNDDVKSLSNIHQELSKLYYLQNNFTQALSYGKEAVKYANLSKSKNEILNANKNLATILYHNRNYQLAYRHLDIAFGVNDTIFSETSSKQIAEMQTKYDTEKKEAENNLLLAEKELDKVELDKKSTQQKMLAVGLGFTMIIVVYVGYSLSQKKKTNKLLNVQNEEISLKNTIIEEKNKDITDSINYAQRIQYAILPKDEILDKQFENFIYYKPKDIVSGDFYWIKEIDTKIYFAVVDCTGHGVPGAFMSIIGHNSLNRIVDDLKIEHTGEVLDELNNLVLKALGNKKIKEISVRDGMDISICCIDKNKNTLEYSGANNSLYLLRKTGKKLNNLEPILQDNNSVFYEVKPNKMAIGGAINNKKYTTHSIQLEKGDTIYLFSDGYADQFGGEKGKKFMYKRFKQMFMSIQDKSMKDQLSHLDKTMINWKGEIEQLDDICVMGVKI